jgi:hypothetical protein
MSIDERSTPEPDDTRGNIDAGSRMSAEEEALVEQEQAAMMATASARTRRSPWRRSPARAALVIALPRIIPAMGMMY